MIGPSNQTAAGRCSGCAVTAPAGAAFCPWCGARLGVTIETVEDHRARAETKLDAGSPARDRARDRDGDAAMGAPTGPHGESAAGPAQRRFGELLARELYLLRVLAVYRGRHRHHWEGALASVRAELAAIERHLGLSPLYSADAPPPAGGGASAPA